MHRSPDLVISFNVKVGSSKHSPFEVISCYRLVCQFSSTIECIKKL
jgi:hypothetical protein